MACHRRSEAATGGPAARSALPGRASRSDQADDQGERPHQPDVPLSPRVVDRHLQDVQDGLLEEVGIEDGHSHCGGDRGGREPAWCGLALSRGEIGVSRSTWSRWARARGRCIAAQQQGQFEQRAARLARMSWSPPRKAS